MFTDIFPEKRAFYDNVEEYSEAREDADNKAPARGILD